MPDPAPTDPTDPQAAKTVELTEKDLKDAARLLRLLAELGFAEQALPAPFPSAGDPAGGAPDRQSLIAKARILLGARRARERYFHRDLFGVPGRGGGQPRSADGRRNERRQAGAPARRPA